MRKEHKIIVERVLLASPEALAKFMNGLSEDALAQLDRILERYEEEELNG